MGDRTSFIPHRNGKPPVPRARNEVMDAHVLSGLVRNAKIVSVRRVFSRESAVHHTHGSCVVHECSERVCTGESTFLSPRPSMSA